MAAVAAGVAAAAAARVRLLLLLLPRRRRPPRPGRPSGRAARLLPRPPQGPVPDPGLPGVRLPGSLSLPHSVEAASALQGPWLTLSNFTGRASEAQVSDPEGKGPLRLYRLKVPFSLPRPE